MRPALLSGPRRETLTQTLKQWSDFLSMTSRKMHHARTAIQCLARRPRLRRRFIDLCQIIGRPLHCAKLPQVTPSSLIWATVKNDLKIDQSLIRIMWYQHAAQCVRQMSMFYGTNVGFLVFPRGRPLLRLAPPNSELSGHDDWMNAHNRSEKENYLVP